eukprot:TRINITY_DN2764_c0_g1_i1.p1 TRINITY_DN2764_c0_g1~~TRINITY_DN2764_c0_g1_i1.p1  ORF type:complete len:338 (-),score=84.55 TRINITY_DN2764_c0_g1_i1:90-1103(-)
MSKRKPVVKCSALNDDEEDFGFVFDAAPKEKKLKKDAAKASDAPAEAAPKKKKEKEFAWMDSSDEEADGEPAPEKDVEEDEAVDEANLPVTVEALDDIQSFGRMMILAPALQKKLQGQSLTSAELAAACRALGRAKFFDGDLLQGLSLVIRQALATDALDVNQVNDCMECVAVLNFSDHELLAAVARAYKPRVQLMQPGMRQTWLDAFKLLKHEKDKDFMQMLEVPPVLASSPSYLRVRCRFFVQGSCALGSECTFAHDARAPPTLADCIADSQIMRTRPTLMTEDQELLGAGTYGKAGNYQARSGMQGTPAAWGGAAGAGPWGMAPTRPPAWRPGS